ncbi:eukaryotic translation initiation factor 2D [Anoplophora glabripennis]|uniref:eukaryotic translation initiation factor 2D n=1 Tax=Anoplophora glabripennis TaxID=217634 RepID=UPI000873B5A8|nr:eukaryotic translation initiation factor 2D [Anoplophora glabripennis]
MFKKVLKIKSNNQLKASERKAFKDLLLKTFPNLTENELNDFLPKKEVLNVVKLVTADDITVQVYTVQKRPMVFETLGRLFPTVYFLWKFPNIIYAFTTHQKVTQFINSGADLMLPGVVVPPPQSGLPKFGSVSENETVYVNLTNNVAAIAVGVTSQSSGAMSLANGRGKCVIIRHFYGDNLCTLDNTPILPIVNLGSPEWLKFKSYEDDFPELGGSSKKLEENGELEDEKMESINVEDDLARDVKQLESTVDTVEDMDATLIYCFLGAVKYSKITLPILTSNFFKLHMLPLCPENKTLDIKKTSFKKLKPFLEKMAEEGIIMVKEVKKGVEQITSINQEHPKYKEFYISPGNRPKKEDDGANVSKTDVVESYIVTQNVLPLFQMEGYNKGDTIQGPDVRKYVTKYVKEHNLQDEKNARLVKPKEVLATICKTTLPINWEEVVEKVCESMRSCYKVRTATEEIINKGKVSPITISVGVRSGNKKVTLVDNLELFGIRLPDFAKECQHGVAASTSISRPPGKKSDQLLVQGNQVTFVYDLLTEKYKVPKKYIQGLENAPKKRK